MKQVSILLSLMLTAVSVIGADYFVDNISGNDNQSGTSPEQAWKSVYKVNIGDFNPGDNINFKRGGFWRDQLSVQSSGLPGSPITYSAYGVGDNPLISAAQVRNGWERASANIWSLETNSTKQVFFDGSRGVRKKALVELRAEHDWYWKNEILYIYSNSDPDDVFQSPGVEVSVKFYAIYTTESYIVFEDLEIGMAGGDGLLVTNGADDVYIRNVVSSNNYWTGIKISDSEEVSDSCSVQNCTVQYNAGSGLAFANIENSIISNNTVTQNCRLATGEEQHNWDSGIKLNGMSTRSNIIENNICSDALHGAGIWLDFCGTENIIRYNQCYGNDDNGIYNEITSSTQIYYNLVYNNAGSSSAAGIWVSGRAGDAPYGGDADSNYVVNNVCYGNGVFGILLHNDDGVPGNTEHNVFQNNVVFNTLNGPNLRVGGGAENSHNTFAYNSFGSETSEFIEWGWNDFLSSYVAWEAEYGGSTYSIEEDPQFVDAAAGDFHMQSTSPSIDAGTIPLIFIETDLDGNPLPQGISYDIGVYESAQTALPPLLYRINCGGTLYTDTEGKLWSADQLYMTGGFGYVDGLTFLTTDLISNTQNDPIYQSERKNVSAYQFSVKNGSYEVTLCFAEIFFNLVEERIMDVALEGEKSITNLDIFFQAGHDAALEIHISRIPVTDRRLDIEFTASVHETKISAIEVFNSELLEDSEAPLPPGNVRVIIPDL